MTIKSSSSYSFGDKLFFRKTTESQLVHGHMTKNVPQICLFPCPFRISLYNFREKHFFPQKWPNRYLCIVKWLKMFLKYVFFSWVITQFCPFYSSSYRFQNKIKKIPHKQPNPILCMVIMVITQYGPFCSSSYQFIFFSAKTTKSLLVHSYMNKNETFSFICLFPWEIPKCFHFALALTVSEIKFVI